LKNYVLKIAISFSQPSIDDSRLMHLWDQLLRKQGYEGIQQHFICSQSMFLLTLEFFVKAHELGGEVVHSAMPLKRHITKS